MSDDQFTKLFKYMEKRFDEVDKRFDRQDKRLDDLVGTIADLAAQIRDFTAELSAQSRQMDRLREAILQIAKETGIKLQADL